MTEKKISDATLTTAASTDLVPIGRPADTTARHVTVATLVQAQQASASARGSVELATDAEAITGTDTERAVTPANLAASATTHVTAATTSAAGKVELATTAETQAGTDTDRAVTAAGLAAYFDQTPIDFGVQGSTEPVLNLATYGNVIYGQVGTNHATFYSQNNDLLAIGFNNFDRVAGQATWILGLEYDYYTSAVDHESEAYFAFTDTDGITSVRPWQVNINRDTLDCIHQFRGTQYFNDSDGNQFVKIVMDSGTEGQVILYSTSNIFKIVNNSPWLYQYNAAGSNSISLAYVNSANQIVIGDGNESSVKLNQLLSFNATVPPAGTNAYAALFGYTDVILTPNYAGTDTLAQVGFAVNTNTSPFEIDIKLSHAGGYTKILGNFSLPEQTSEPSYIYDGMLVYADGTSWNPGSGEGFYGRVNGSWAKL